jgi:hypothetical protein
MVSEEKQFWYALTIFGSGLVMIGVSSQTPWGILLTLGGGIWLLYLDRERIRAGLRNFLRDGEQQGATEPLLVGDRTTINIQDPKGGEVPRRKRATGFVQPPSDSVQVLVQAGPETDQWWYRQLVHVKSGQWTARCTIGAEDSPTGGIYRLCAIVGAAPVPDRFKDLPSDGVRSEIVSVTLNRDLSDDWIQQFVAKKEEPRLTASTPLERSSLIAALTEHHKRGKFLFSVPVTDNAHFEPWKLNVLSWRRDVIASLPVIDAVRFDSPVSAVDSSRLHSDALNHEHEQLKNRIIADLAMIEQIMDRHATR